MKNNGILKVINLRCNIAVFTLASTFTLTDIIPNTYKEAIINGVTKIVTIDLNFNKNNMFVDAIVPCTANVELLDEYEPVEIKVLEPDYSGMKLSNEYEDEIKKLADRYNIPYQIILTIGYRESAGNWNNNGVISATSDYGVFQINECNLDYIEENLGYSKEDVLNDPIKNAESCMFILKDIIKRDDVTTLEEIFGMYNGWVNWKNKEQSVSYSNACCEIMTEYFPEFEYIKAEKASTM